MKGKDKSTKERKIVANLQRQAECVQGITFSSIRGAESRRLLSRLVRFLRGQERSASGVSSAVSEGESEAHGGYWFWIGKLIFLKS
jgi:hypothetical protein